MLLWQRNKHKGKDEDQAVSWFMVLEKENKPSTSCNVDPFCCTPTTPNRLVYQEEIRSSKTLHFSGKFNFSRTSCSVVSTLLCFPELDSRALYFPSTFSFFYTLSKRKYTFFTTHKSQFCKANANKILHAPPLDSYPQQPGTPPPFYAT